MGGPVFNQTTRNANMVIGGRAPGNLIHGSKEDTPNREAIRTERTPGRHPQGAPEPPKVRIDEERDNKATAGDKGEEEHQIHKGAPPADVGNRAPPRAVTSRRDRPAQGGTPQARHKQIHSGKYLRQERPYACTKCK